MKIRYKIILNVEVTDPQKPFPAGGDYAHLNRIDGTAKLLVHAGDWLGSDIKISLDKIVGKGEVQK